MALKLDPASQKLLFQTVDNYVAFMKGHGYDLAVNRAHPMDYGLKINLSGHNTIGVVQIFYSAKKQRFSFTPQNIQGDEARLAALWREFEVPKKPQAVSIDPSKGLFGEAPVASGPEVGAPVFEAYVDGSFEPSIPRAGAGWVLLEAGVLRAGWAEPISKGLEYRNITGELTAAIRVLEHCEQAGIAEVTIYHDLEATGYWARGEWKRKNPLTQRFFERVQKCPVKVRFVWVKGHAGVKWNEFVDKLTTQATVRGERVSAVEG